MISVNASDAAAPRTIEREHWTLIEAGPGRLTVRLHSFAHFETYVRTLDIFAREMVWRGHASPDWPLNSSLDRLRARCGWTLDEKFTRAHLDRFKEAARGRFERGITPSDEDGWWAIGRHFGLATPLLDWTRSPFIAAYFAYCEEPPMTQHYRCVYGLSTMWVNGLKNGGTDVEAAVGGPVLHMVSPFSQDNTRLIAQDALFSRAPDGQSIEDYVGARAAKQTRQVYLLRIEMPDAERLQALQHLRLMNISHRTLFPDLSGAAVTTNLDYELGPFAEAGRFSS